MESKKKTWYKRQAIQFEESRFGAMTFMMTFQSCLGSIAAMSSLYQQNYVLLSIVAVVTLASNAAFIAQASAKWCLNLFYTSVIANLAIILLNVIL